MTKEGLWRKMNAGPGMTEGRRRIDESSRIQTVQGLSGEAAKTEELKLTEEHTFKERGKARGPDLIKKSAYFARIGIAAMHERGQQITADPFFIFVESFAGYS